MTTADAKKPYAPPKIFQVELNQEQAILAACHATATAANNRGTARCRTTCRRHASGGNSGAPAS